MAGRSYSGVRGVLRPPLGSMPAAPTQVAAGKPPAPPKQPNRIPSSLYKRGGKGARG